MIEFIDLVFWNYHFLPLIFSIIHFFHYQNLLFSFWNLLRVHHSFFSHSIIISYIYLFLIEGNPPFSIDHWIFYPHPHIFLHNLEVSFQMYFFNYSMNLGSLVDIFYEDSLIHLIFFFKFLIISYNYLVIQIKNLNFYLVLLIFQILIVIV